MSVEKYRNLLYEIRLACEKDRQLVNNINIKKLLKKLENSTWKLEEILDHILSIEIKSK